MDKVLITNTSLRIPHGSETWVQTVALGFKDLGFDVHVFSPVIGEFYHENLEPHGIKQGIPEHPVLCIFNHLASIRPHIPDYLIDGENNVVMCHGIAPPPEKPYYLPKARYVCVSDEIRRFYPHIPFEIVGQPISGKWFDAERKASSSLTKILWASHRHPLPGELLQECNKRGISVEHLGGNGITPPARIFEKYLDVDLVIGTGRWIYQAIAMGIPAVVADSRVNHGYVDANSYQTFNEVNMTTRHRCILPESFYDTLEGFDPGGSKEIQGTFFVKHHAIAVCVKLLEIGIEPPEYCEPWDNNA